MRQLPLPPTSRRATPRAFAGLCGVIVGTLLLACAPVRAADIGGFYADQQKAQAAAAERAAEPGCPQQIAGAAADGSALAAWRAGLCYLQAEEPDLLAAKAWLARSAELGFMPAHRLLRSMQAAEAGPHTGVPHCHSLGDGQQLCHGGASRLAAVPLR